MFNPVDKERIIFVAEPSTPPITLVYNDVAPEANPLPSYRGPLTSPSTGLLTISFNPVLIFKNNPLGSPNTVRDPNTL